MKSHCVVQVDLEFALFLYLEELVGKVVHPAFEDWPSAHGRSKRHWTRKWAGFHICFFNCTHVKKKTRWRKWARLGKYAWETESSQETRNWCTAQSVNIFERLFKGQWERSKSKALATKSNYPSSVSRTHILGKIGFLQCQTCKYIYKYMRYTCNISKLIKEHPVFSWGSRFPWASELWVCQGASELWICLLFMALCCFGVLQFMWVLTESECVHNPTPVPLCCAPACIFTCSRDYISLQKPALLPAGKAWGGE